MEQTTDRTNVNRHPIEQDSTISTEFNYGRTISSTKNVKDVNTDVMNRGEKCVDVSECIGETNFIDMNGRCAIGNDTKENVAMLNILDRNHSIKRIVQFNSNPAEVVSNGSISGTIPGDVLNSDDNSVSFNRSPYSTLKTRESLSSAPSQCENCSNDNEDEEEVDESSLEEQFSEPQPPDGGWGWVVVVAAFVTNMIADGVTFTFGIIYVDLLKYFGEGKSKTAWIGGLFMSMPLISGPIASYLTERFGCRPVCMFGAILSACGFVISSFAESIELLIFTFGILSGFGLALCYVTAIVIVAYYFDKRRSLATGLSVCGSGIGTFLFAPLTTFLVTEYGWRGTTLILAGLFLNMAVCGALMRDLEWTKAKSKARRQDRKQKHRDKRKNKMCIQSLSNVESFSHQKKLENFPSVEELKRLLERGENPGYMMCERHGGKNGTFRSASEDPNRLCSSVLNLPTFVNDGEKVPIEVLELLSSNRHLCGVLMQNYPTLLTASRSCSDCGRLHENKIFVASNRLATPPPLVVIPHPSIRRQSSLNYHDIRFEKELPKNSTPEEAYLWWLKKTQYHNHHHHSSRRSSSAHIKDLKFPRHSLTYRGAMLNLKRHRLRASSCPNICRNPMSTTSNNEHEWFTGLYDLRDLMVDMVDLSYFTDIRFVLFAISNFLLYSWYHVPYMFLADKAREMGFTEDESSNIISYLGIFNTVGEVILGWAGDQPKLNAGMIYAFCMAMCGVTTAIMPLLSDYTGLCVLTGGFGLSIAANYSMASIILVEIITLERFTNAYGLLLLVQGLANLVGPPLAGWLYDTSGNYDLSFYLAGFFIMICGSLLIVLPVMKWTKKWRKTKTNMFFPTTLEKSVPPQQNSLFCADDSDTKPCNTEINQV